MIGTAWAQAGQNGPPSALMNFLPLILIFVVFYFLLIRPQHQKQKQHQQLTDNLKPNDDVITAGGLYGKVIALTDRVITLEIAPNVRVRVDRHQIVSLAGTATPKSKEKEKDKQK